jgi:glycosyltransferase involved in cell wall biosynthesis
MAAPETIIEIGTGYTSIPSKVGAATEIVVEELTRSLRKQGKQVVIFDVADPGRLPNDLPMVEVPMPLWLSSKSAYNLGITHKLKRLSYSLSLAKQLKKYTRGEGHYTIHFHNQYNFFFYKLLSGMKQRPNLTLLYTTHSGIWSMAWDTIRDKIRIKYFMEQFSMKHADRSYVLNEAAFTNIQTHLGIRPPRLRMIPNGVNTQVYRRLETGNPAVQALRQKLGLSDEIVIFLAGTIEERKNQLDIVRWLTPSFRTVPRLCFLYAGGVRNPEYQQSIETYVKEHGLEKQVRYLGELSPGKVLNEYYNIADAFILASRFEAFPLVTLEALSAGLPVLLSGNLMIDYFKKDDTGILPFSDPAALTEVLAREILPEDRRAIHGRHARHFIENHFSWDHITREYFNERP